MLLALVGGFANERSAREHISTERRAPVRHANDHTAHNHNLSRTTAHTTPDANALAAIVGKWQSDTVNGISALSNCVWTPEQGAVLCEQHLEGAPGVRTALNLFAADSASGVYALYVLTHAGDTLTPVPIVIRGKLWFYGGTARARDGRFYRTVNDFSRVDQYTWRQENSADGKEWTAGIHGQSRRIR